MAPDTRRGAPDLGLPDAGVAVARRAPFSDNPHLGVRGLRTRQRILDAALLAFGEAGVRECSVERIAALARCSRVSLYQYFASKDDLFRNLAGQVARQVSASTEALDPLTDDATGWEALRVWIGRYAEIHARYAPVFHAIESDDVLATVAWRTGEETVARIHARLAASPLTDRQLDSVIRLLLECFNHTLDISGILRSVVPGSFPAEQVELAFTDVMHRTLCGLRPDVNVHTGTGAPAPPLEPGAGVLDLLRQADAAGPDGTGHRAYDDLVAAAPDVFVERGYHNTRIEDLVRAAGISRGAFYRYFRSKDQLARVLTARAVRVVRGAILEMPDPASLDGPSGPATLRRWLRRYHSAHTGEAAMLRAWIDAAHQDPALRAESAPRLDWGRRHMTSYLTPRGFGDVDTDALVLVALLGVFGARARPAAAVDAAALVIERGLLGRSRTGEDPT
jgi:AcrR family transcriptional regulator